MGIFFTNNNVWKFPIIPSVTNKYVSINLDRLLGDGKGYSVPPLQNYCPPPLFLLSSFVINKIHGYYVIGASLLDRRGLIRATSVTYCESQTTSRRKNAIVYIDTRIPTHE